MINNGLMVLLLAFLLSGCTTTYYYDKKSYPTAESALSAQAVNLNKLEGTVKAVGAHAYDSVLIVTPSKSTCFQRGIATMGNPNREVLDYISSTMTRDYERFGKYLEHSKLFRVVESKIVDTPRYEAGKHLEKFDTVIYLHMQSPTQISWYALQKGGQPVAITIDPMAGNGEEIVASWLQRVKEFSSSNVKS
mgnify:CR=1 FL=1